VPIIVLDGPEKAGKTTLANYIVDKHKARYRHWGPVKSEAEYLKPLKDDIESGELVVWDRSWVSEHVYGVLLNRECKLRDDPWWGEWAYGRAIKTAGTGVILIGPSLDHLRSARTADDHPVDPALEVNAYRNYAHRFGWGCIQNSHAPGAVERLGDVIVAQAVTGAHRDQPPMYCGPNNAMTVVLGEARNQQRTVPGGWLPFTSPFTTQFGRLFGDTAFKVGWTNVFNGSRRAVEGATVVVACGQIAADYAKQHSKGAIIEVAHPAYIYRWNQPALREGTETKVKDLLKDLYSFERGLKNVG